MTASTQAAATFLDTFAEPPAAYRPAPFFVLNDEFEGAAGEARITEVLEGYRRVGYGGAFLHPRPGLITEYLSPRWFEIIRHAVRECIRLGLVPYLYDENSYPSGVGGGHVPSLVPEARGRYVAPVVGTGPASIPPKTVALHRWERDQPGPTVDRDEVQPDDAWIAFAMNDLPPSPWHGETACPSLLDSRVVETFLEVTHEAYERELGDLWSEVPAIFTDEPCLPSPGAGLHLTPYALGEFERRRGYDLRPHVSSLYFDTGDFRAIRFDYYDLIHELWMENWARPLEAWCETHDIALTGHFFEHVWPSPYINPGHVHLLAHMQWPGTDMLETFLLAGHDFLDVQGFYPAPDGQEPHALFYLRQVHGVVNQLGKERNIDECWGAGGHDSTPADWARIGRWLAVHGVNLFNPHLSFTTIRGTRKADHPQTFSDHSPWFEHLRPLNDELSRLAWISNQGEIEQRVLVLDPQTTGYCLARRSDALPSGLRGASAQSSTSFPDIQFDIGELAQGLSDRQVDFDPGDEYVITEFGRVDGDRLVVGEQTYELIVWPGCLTNLRAETASLLRDYIANGGRIVGVRPETITIDGRPSEFLTEIDDVVAWLPDRDALIAAVTEIVPPRIVVASPPPTGLAHMRRVTEWGEVFVVVNSSAEAIDSEAILLTASRGVTELDPVIGRSFALPATREGDRLRTRLTLPPRGATILITTDDALAPDAPPPPRIAVTGSGVALEPVRIARTDPNVLVIDSCELSMAGQTYSRMAVYAANQRLWEAHGFETNGWFAVIQYRDQMLARNRNMEPASGGTVTYRFEIAEGVDLHGIRLAIETPELWRVTVNDQPVAFDAAERWLDVNIGAVSVGDLLAPGENVVTLTGMPFDVRREIDQIYLLGEFGVEASDPGFRIVLAQPLALGAWRDRGLPFYDREVSYTFRLPGDASGTLAFDADAWTGSYLLIEQGGEIVAQLAEAPFVARLEPARGEEVTIRVIGLPKNLLGPFHDPDKPRKRAWTRMWWGPGIPAGPQPGSAYDLLDLGLFAAPTWHTDRVS